MGSQPCKSEGAIRTVDGRAHHADAIRRGNAPPLHTRAVGVGGEYASHANTWGAMGGSGVCRSPIPFLILRVLSRAHSCQLY
jgi:hypothetical protein